MFFFKLILLIILSSLLLACSKEPFYADERVADCIEQRIGSQVEWRRGALPDEQIEQFISQAIAKELDPTTAIQISLFNNPKIQAAFEELGIAQADLVEAGLLTNPSFELEARYPCAHALKTNIEYLITSSLLDLFLIPLRQKLAAIDLEMTKLKLCNQILDLAFEVRETLYELVAERKKSQYLRSLADLSSILYQMTLEQMSVSNVNALQLQLAQAQVLEAEIELSQSQAEIIKLQEKLNRLLGFSAEVCIKVPDGLPAIDYAGFDLCALESMALNERLDLQAARLEIGRFYEMLGLKQPWTYTNLRAGIAGERDPDGLNLVGFGVAGEVPLFNYGQAARSRLCAQLRQAQDLLAEQEVHVLSEVRQAHKLLMSHLNIILEYKTRLIPLQAQIASSSEKYYNVMGLGLDKLIENKRLEVLTQKNYYQSIRSYFTSRVALDRALGGNLFRLSMGEGDVQCDFAAF